MEAFYMHPITTLGKLNIWFWLLITFFFFNLQLPFYKPTLDVDLATSQTASVLGINIILGFDKKQVFYDCLFGLLFYLQCLKFIFISPPKFDVVKNMNLTFHKEN